MGCTMGGAAKRDEHPLEALLMIIARAQEAQLQVLIDIRTALELLVVEVDEDGQPITHGDSVN